MTLFVDDPKCAFKNVNDLNIIVHLFGLFLHFHRIYEHLKALLFITVNG